MTWLAAIDEAGDLGFSTRHFIMSAIITKRVRTLKTVFKTIPKKDEESKFCNTSDDEIMDILKQLSKADVSIVTVIVDKHDYDSNYYGKHGNELYRLVLSDLMNDVFKLIGHHDVYLYVDRSTFIGLNTLRLVAHELSIIYGCNLKRCEKATSHQNKCVQIADYVVGSFFVNSEYEDDKFISIIKNNVPAPKY